MSRVVEIPVPVTALDGPPGGTNCFRQDVTYKVGWNPLIIAPAIIFEPPRNVLIIMNNNSVSLLSEKDGDERIVKFIPESQVVITDVAVVEGRAVFLGLNGVFVHNPPDNSLFLFGDTGENFDLGQAITPETRGGFIVGDNRDDGSLLRYDNEGSFVETLPETPVFPGIQAVNIDPFTGRILVLDGQGQLWTLDPANGAPVFQPFNLRSLGGTDFVVSLEGLLVTYTSNGGGVAVVDKETGEQISFFAFQDLTSPAGIVVANGKIYVSETASSGRHISVYDEDTRELLTEFDVGGKRPTKMAELSKLAFQGKSVLEHYLAMPISRPRGDFADIIRAIAISNRSPGSTKVAVEYHEGPLPDPSSIGSPAASPQGASVADLDLGAGEQVALLLTDLFESDPDVPGWIALTSDTSAIGTFFQFGTSSLSQLDGGVAITEMSSKFTLTRVSDGPATFRGQDAVTGVTIFNPNQEAVTVSLTYLAGNGGASVQGAQQVMRQIPARGVLSETASELFGGGSLSGGIIAGEVTQGEGVVAFEVIQLQNQSTVLGLNAATGNSGVTAYSAQLASQPGLFTSVNLINLAGEARNVTLRAIGEDGRSLADPVTRLVQPGQSFTEDARVLFGDGMAGQVPSGEVNLVGSLVVEADGDGIVGDVIFGDPINFEYAASLPLQTRTFEEALFNQVANIACFFTGLAFFYPGDSQATPQGEVPDAEITIQVFLPSGEMVGESVQTLAVGERLSKLVAQLVEDAVNLGGGYVRIFSTQPIIGQMLFGVVGPQGIQLFSAVPPTVIR